MKTRPLGFAGNAKSGVEFMRHSTPPDKSERNTQNLYPPNAALEKTPGIGYNEAEVQAKGPVVLSRLVTLHRGMAGCHPVMSCHFSRFLALIIQPPQGKIKHEMHREKASP